MALYNHGITLKQLLEDPNLLNPRCLKAIAEKQRKDDFELDHIFAGASAFLGPNIWGKDEQIPYDQIPDFQLEYMDLDEFLNENGVNDDQAAHGNVVRNIRSPVGPQTQQAMRQQMTPPVPSPQNNHMPLKHESPVLCQDKTLDRLQSPVGVCSNHEHIEKDDLELAQIPGQEEFDPTKRQFSIEELRPQPMIKKSKKVYITDELKDDKYWCRRHKNNVAAKRSRDARRIKENQIALRAAFLEKQNTQLKIDLGAANEELKLLKARLAKYERTS